jgi:uncharacterized protein (TIGR02058 family)
MAATTGLRRAILEMGTGNDLHGGDYTKAALRGIDDALHHSSLTFMRSLGRDIESMVVKVTVGVQRPEAVDVARVSAALPHGQVSVQVVRGGLDVEDHGRDTPTVIASVAIEVWIEPS